MKYFIDCEFFEGFNKPLFGKERHFIDLISIGIIAEDGREFYAISKDFYLKTVWNKWEPKRVDVSGDGKNIYPEGFYIKKDYWLRYNVLKPIFWELVQRHRESDINVGIGDEFSYKNLNKYLNKYGKSNKQIAEEIKDFCGNSKPHTLYNMKNGVGVEPEFYGYYADYDWVLLCSLFGRMINLPKGFPMYMRDLKQTLDDVVMKEAIGVDSALKNGVYPVSNNYIKPISVLFDEMLIEYKESPEYPKQENEHNSLSDAKWNKGLYEFINKI